MRHLKRAWLFPVVLCAIRLGAFAASAPGPRVVSATAVPTPVTAGQPVRLICSLSDGEALKSIIGSVREVPSWKVTFAQEPDGSWTYTIPVPGNSEPGTYHIDLELIGADGQAIAPAAGPTTIDIVVVAPAKAEQAPAPEGINDHGAPETHMVPMRDGVRLATDVHPGRGEAPWPVILLRSPYGKKNAKVSGLEDYAIVVQDVRGRFDSEGDAMIAFDDGWGQRQDGLDTVKWILAQPWCNGKIGSMGESYLGLTQNLLAGADPEGVVCQRIEFAPGDVYQDAAYPGGVFAESLMAGWLKQKGWSPENLRLVLAHPADDDLWRSVDSSARIQAEHVTIPAVHIGGWYDIFAQGTLDSFMTRTKLAPNQWLVMGPWTHSAFESGIGELVFPDNAAQVPEPGSASSWFDYWLRGIENGVTQTAHVHYYVMGACSEAGAPGNEWRSTETWPVAATPTALFVGPNQELLPEAPTESSSAGYDYDPANPVPTRGGANLLLPAGPMDQRELEMRKDVLVFSTPPLEKPIEVTGRVMLRLYASSSARDTVFTAKLSDVYPDGRSMLLCDGALRAACRESLSDPSPLEPGKIYRFNVDLGSTSIIFNKGHRIRVDVSSSNAPRFAVHPNVWGEGQPQVATQTVYCGGDHSSAVILPVAATHE